MGEKKSQKIVFLYAFILTLVLFNIGIFFGVNLESSRVEKIKDFYSETELRLLDQDLQRQSLETLDLSCDEVFSEIVRFADQIYGEAQEISNLESVNSLSSEVTVQHQRFDLLRTRFWLDSIALKKECGFSYHNVVYLYDYIDPSLETKAKQNFFSNVLFEVKQEQGQNILLIPIAADLDSPAIQLILDHYGITEDDLPVIFIDEKVKITDVENFEDVNKFLS